LPDNLRVLRRRDFRLLFLGQGVSVLGNRMVAVALAFAVLEVGGSTSAVGLVLACATLPLAGSVLIGGVVADRTSRRAVMIGADLVRVASQGATAGLLIAGTAEVWTLALFAGITGAATGFFSPASTGLLPEVVPPDELQPANALRATAVSGGEIAGPLIAGVLVAAAGAGWAIAVDAATFAVSALCLWRLRVPRRVASASASFLGDLRDGWDAFRSRRWVWTFVVYFALVNMMWGAWSALGPVVADRELGGAAAWGVVLGSVGAGALFGSLLATRAKPKRPLVLVAFTEAFVALPLAFLAAGAPTALLACGAFLSGAGIMLGMSVWESTLQRLIPAESLSRVSSFDWFGSFVFYPVGLAVWGPVAGLIGLSTSLWLAFGLFLSMIAVQLAVPDTRRLRVETAPTAG
jgi:predicted MFS family arabinose efflux permease